MEFKDIVHKRHAVKKFNAEKIPQSKVDELLDLIRHAPSSFNLQPWKIMVISDEATKQKLLPASWNQPQITTCSHLLVFCADTNIAENIDKLENLFKQNNIPTDYIKIMRDFDKNMNPEQRKSWAQRQLYLALGNALNGATSLGFDSCPMEGFMPEEYSKILSLPKNLIPTVLCPIGHAAHEARQKVRFSKEDIIF